MAIEIVPAILVKSREDMKRKFLQVAPYVSRVQLDIMDGIFVPNKTLDISQFPPVPQHLLAEYHLMVENPLDYVKKIGKKGAIYELHIESLIGAGGRGGIGSKTGAEQAEAVNHAISEVKKLGGRVALAISPDTPVQTLEPYLPKIEQVLVMTVYPGFSGQKYLHGMEEKMRYLSSRGVIVEVDGGVDIGSAGRAARAGATLLGVASGIFSKPDLKQAIEELKRDAEV